MTEMWDQQKPQQRHAAHQQPWTKRSSERMAGHGYFVERFGL